MQKEIENKMMTEEKKVIKKVKEETPKQKYAFPNQGVSIEAFSYDEALKILSTNQNL